MALVGSGHIGWGDVDTFGVVLERETTYTIYVRPTDPSVDFDLYIYDENGNLVASDDTTDPDALCQIRPNWTGPFKLAVKAARGGSAYTVEVRN